MRLFVNNWATQLSDPLLPGATTLHIPAADAERLPGPASGDRLHLTLVEKMGQSEVRWEVVRVTGIDGGTLTVARGQDGTADAEWPAGSSIELRLTAGDLAAMQAGGGGGGGGDGRFGSPRLPVGQSFCPFDHTFQSSTASFSPNNADLVPFEVDSPIWIDRLSVRVNTAAPTISVRLALYDSDVAGWPDQLLNTGDLTAAATGFQHADLLDPAFLEPGRLYWLGMRVSGSVSLDTIATRSIGTGIRTVQMLRRNVFSLPGVSTPDEWGGFLASDLSSSTGAAPLIVIRRCAPPEE